MSERKQLFSQDCFPELAHQDVGLPGGECAEGSHQGGNGVVVHNYPEGLEARFRAFKAGTSKVLAHTAVGHQGGGAWAVSYPGGNERGCTAI